MKKKKVGDQRKPEQKKQAKSNSKHESNLAKQMKVVHRIMRENEDVLRRLADTGKSQLTPEELEDAADVRRINHILKNGEFISWEEAKAFLDRKGKVKKQ